MWLAVVVTEEEIHILPHEDLIEHMESEECVCGPSLQDLGDGQIMISHASLDGREFNEPDWKG